MKPLPDNFVMPQKPSKTVRKYTFIDSKIPNLVDQMSMLTSMSKTEVVAASIEIAASIYKISKTVFDSVTDDKVDMSDLVSSIISIYKQP